MTRRFTGWHMAAILIGFFGVVIAVNLVMATSAVRTFGGVTVENSYVASQRFNTWLAEARAQESLGWRSQVSGTPRGALVVRLTSPPGPIEGARVKAAAEHPLGRLPGRSFALTAIGGGRYSALHALPAGRWRISVDASAAGHEARFVSEVRL